ncbi:hypothetical protein [Mesobacillus jeotgali]|uniref:hypothetical protein n=1 Tax=Mesobacillus jeotgali TaxID=129985 RepID=UPI0009A69506|nr:hypothetical protein [Mesobacillus jeotgali]
MEKNHMNKNALNENKINILSSNKFIFIVTFFLLIIITSIFTFSFSVFVAQILFATFTIIFINRKFERSANIYLLIYLVSISFVFLIYYANQIYYGSPYYIGGSDDLNFEKWGIDVYDANLVNPHKVLESGIIGQFHNSPFFAVYMSILIRFSNIFGEYSTFLPRILNVYYLIWICMLLEFLLKKYADFSFRKIKLSIIIFALTPNIQFINAHVFRDTFNLLQIMLIVILFDQLISRNLILKKLIYIIFLSFIIFITFYTRTNSLVFSGVLIIFILAVRLKINLHFYLLAIIPFVILSDFTELIGLKKFTEIYGSYVQTNAGDGLSRIVFTQPLVPFGIILRGFYAFITPFPNFFDLFKEPNKVLFDITMLLVYLGVVLQIFAIPFIIKRIFKIDWLSLSFLIWFLAIIATTFTFRHILIYYPFLVAVGVDGYILSSKINRKISVFFVGLMGISLAVIYISLKFL